MQGVRSVWWGRFVSFTRAVSGGLDAMQCLGKGGEELLGSGIAFDMAPLLPRNILWHDSVLDDNLCS